MRSSWMGPDMGADTHRSGKTKNHRPWIVPIVFISVLLAPALISLAQDASERGEGRKPYKLSPSLLTYLQDKYVHINRFMISTLQETPDGPLRRIDIRGKIAPAAEIKEGFQWHAS